MGFELSFYNGKKYSVWFPLSICICMYIGKGRRREVEVERESEREDTIINTVGVQHKTHLNKNKPTSIMQKLSGCWCRIFPSDALYFQLKDR